MSLFRAFALLALCAAFVVGSVQTALMQWWATPLIIQAERFEHASPQAATPSTESDHDHGEHAHDDQAWAPQAGLERTFWTWTANIAYNLALAFLAIAAVALWTWRKGFTSAVWIALGTAASGFLSLHWWPSWGLHAELPGMLAANVGVRQSWWLLASVSAAAACAVFAFGRGPWYGPWRLLPAALLLSLVWIFPAPQIADPFADFSGAARSTMLQLALQFVLVTHVLAAIQWLLLGIVVSFGFQRWVLPHWPLPSAHPSQLPPPGHRSA